ncbi:hypothetical protein SAMN05216516_101114 [Izhakiella capsodis]|uniref:Uncharacterized protein n=1 Tax=Izhakiella capsodis TaxID=1367852 RepID=A0A1I4UGQ2_9GAMM|nr:hypothetical protein [Izhakiella capsodis]SFM88031.1 hypothetical protein SAMN05216516_101114 [Izhakiella capsodis]
MPQNDEKISLTVLAIILHPGSTRFNRRFILVELHDSVHASSAATVFATDYEYTDDPSVTGENGLEPFHDVLLADFMLNRYARDRNDEQPRLNNLTEALEKRLPDGSLISVPAFRQSAAVAENTEQH